MPPAGNASSTARSSRSGVSGPIIWLWMGSLLVIVLPNPAGPFIAASNVDAAQLAVEDETQHLIN